MSRGVCVCSKIVYSLQFYKLFLAQASTAPLLHTIPAPCREMIFHKSQVHDGFQRVVMSEEGSASA